MLEFYSVGSFALLLKAKNAKFPICADARTYALCGELISDRGDFISDLKFKKIYSLIVRCPLRGQHFTTVESDLLDRLKTLCGLARSILLQFIRPISQNYKSDYTELVQRDSINFSCLSLHSVSQRAVLSFLVRLL